MTYSEIITDAFWDEISEMLEEQKEKGRNFVCSHVNKEYNQSEGTEVCLDCGVVVTSRICQSCEWNNYKSEDGTFSFIFQRADLYVSDNPYDNIRDYSRIL